MRNKTPKVSIIILNFNGVEDTKECIDSLLKSDYPYFDIIVVDNASVNSEADILHNYFYNKITIVKSSRNLGFTGGNNLGIKHAQNKQPDYILLLNNDTIVEKDFLEKLLLGFEFDDKIGMCIPKINYYSNKNIVWSTGGYICPIRGSGISIGDGKKSDYYNRNHYRTFGSGCCMIIKSSVFEEKIFFDDNFFLYLEDVDLCYQFKNRNLRILFVNNSIIYHKINKSTKDSRMLIYYTTRNRLYFAKKNLFISWIPYLYIFITMGFKILLLFNEKKESLRILYLAFKDYHKKNMGELLNL